MQAIVLEKKSDPVAVADVCKHHDVKKNVIVAVNKSNSSYFSILIWQEDSRSWTWLKTSDLITWTEDWFEMDVAITHAMQTQDVIRFASKREFFTWAAERLR